MSGRTIPRFVLVGLLAVACAVPLGAQYPSGTQYPTGTPCTPSVKPVPDKLTGTWYRQIDGAIVAATFAGDELKMCVTINADGTLINVTLTADYVVTKNGLVHGAISGVDWNVKPKQKDEQPLDLDALAGSRTILEALIDCPFSFRTRSTSAGLMVSNIKVAADDESFIKTATLFGGMFTFCKDGIVPTPKPAKTTTNYGGMTLPSPRYLEHYPQYFAPDSNHPLPRELANMEDPEGTARRVGLSTPNSPPTMPTPNYPMGLLQSPEPRCMQQTPPNVTPTASPQPPVSETVHTTGWTVQVITPPSATPLPPAVAKPGIVGTWYREFGSKLCVIKITPDYMTMTVIVSGEVEGKIATATCVTTADYHISRDGMTIVGLITGLDAQIEGDVPEQEVKDLGEMIDRDRKIKEDQPFALTFRMYGDSLVIHNVRMPEGRDGHEDNPLQTGFGGTYKNAGDKPLPKPKVTKVSRPAETCVSGSIDLPSTTGLTPALPGTPRMVEPTAPVPTMPEPIPPATNSSEKKSPATSVGLSPTSPVESPKSDTKETKKQPALFFAPKSKQAPESHLHPEKIHGGIIRLVPSQPDAIPIAGATQP